MPVVTKDATSGTWFPASAAEWTSLLSGTGLTNPTNLWLSQEAAGNLADSIGTQTLTAGSVLGYNEAIAGLTRTGYRIGTGATQAFSSAAGPIGTGTDSQMVLAFVAAYGAQGVDRDIIGIQGGTGYRGAQFSAADKFKYNVNDGSAAATGTATPGTSFHPLILQIDRTNAANRIVTDQEFITQAPNTTPANVAANFFVGCAIAPGGALARVAYKAGWHGAGAELTTTQISILLNRLAIGPGVSSIAVSPSARSFTGGGGTQQLTATCTRADTTTYDGTATVTYSSSAPAVATVSASGLVTAIGVGTATITASFTSLGATAVSGTSAITVSSGITLSSLVITPNPAATATGGSVQLTATGTYSDASTANVTTTAAWSSGTPSVATVGAATGIVTGVTVGASVITATIGAVSNVDTVNVVTATGVTYNGRIEALINIPAGIIIGAANVGGNTTAPLVQGAYYMTDLLAHVASQLNVYRPGATWTVAMSVGVGGTGRVSINCTGGAWSLSFLSVALRQLLGFAADISGVSTAQTGAQQARGVWMPDCPIAMDQDPMMAPRETDLRVTESPTGVGLGWFGNSKYVHTNVRWSHVTKNRVAKIFEVIPNQSWETFLLDTQWGIGTDLAAGLFRPESSCRIYDLAGNLVGTNLTYGWTLVGVDAFKPKMAIPGHTNLYTIEVARMVSATAV